MTDITFELSGTRINLRVGAIISFRDKVLICRLPGAGWWYVPGGRIAVGESSLEALKRELAEEITGEWEIESPIASSENFFEFDGNTYQEQCMYYSVSWRSTDEGASALSHEEFRWVSRDEIPDYVVKPPFVKALLLQQDNQLRHFIHHDAQQGGELDAATRRQLP